MLLRNLPFHPLLFLPLRIERIREKDIIDTTYEYGRKRIINDVENLLHDWEIMQNQKALRIVKGGSWADAPLYMHVGMNEIYPENKSSCRIGFRVAMPLSKEMLPYFYKNKFLKIQKKKREKIDKERRAKMRASRRRKA